MSREVGPNLPHADNLIDSSLNRALFNDLDLAPPTSTSVNATADIDEDDEDDEDDEEFAGMAGEEDDEDNEDDEELGEDEFDVEDIEDEEDEGEEEVGDATDVPQSGRKSASKAANGSNVDDLLPTLPRLPIASASSSKAIPSQKSKLTDEEAMALLEAEEGQDGIPDEEEMVEEDEVMEGGDLEDLDEDDEAARQKGVPNLAATSQRIQKTARILGNWKEFERLGQKEEGRSAGEEGGKKKKSRADYMEMLKNDCMEYYGYNDYLAEKVLDLFGPEEVSLGAISPSSCVPVADNCDLRLYHSSTPQKHQDPSPSARTPSRLDVEI